MFIGKYEFVALLIFCSLVFLQLINKPLCAVCFFEQKPSAFLTIPKEARTEALITSEPEIGYKSQRFEASFEGHIVVVVADRYQRVAYGDRIAIKGAIGAPRIFEDQTFYYQAYLLRKKIEGVAYFPSLEVISTRQGNPLLQRLYSFKETLRRPILTYLPEPHASFLLSMTLGDDWRIPPDFHKALVQSGTIHIVSISGFHMTVITALVFIILIMVGCKRPFASIATLGIISLYIMMVGSSSAAIRAGIMSMLLLASYLYGRMQKMLHSLLIAAIVMVLWDNSTLYDIGFQLSFAAMAGLAIFYPVFSAWFHKIFSQTKNGIMDIIPASLGANVAIFPILAYHFGQFSFISPIANLFILPVIPLLMLLGFLAEFTGWFIAPLWLLLEYTVRMITVFGTL